MRSKPILFAVILLVPVVVLGFLYWFGENRYTVKGNRLAGMPTPTLDSLLPLFQVSDTSTLVALVGHDSLYAGLRSRVAGRVLRLQKQGGTLRLVRLGNEEEPQTYLSEGPDNVLRRILTIDLGLPADTTPLGPWFLLRDAKGKLLNVYDLSQERLLDTLAIEATIQATGNH